MVANGEENLNSVEVINLQVENSVCKNLPDFKFISKQNIGFLFNNTIPFICGGHDGITSRSECFSLKLSTDEWTPSKFLNVPRADSAIVPNTAQTEFMVIGGHRSDTLLNSMEVYSLSGWTQLKNADLAAGVRSACAVALTNVSVILIGGWTENGEALQNTFLFNKSSNVWHTFSPLNTGRSQHSCGKMASALTNEDYIIVAGGWNGEGLSSTELLEPGSTIWKNGPELPRALQGGNIVEDTYAKRILFIGGSNAVSGISSDLITLKFPLSATSKWEILPQKLKQPRKFATSFLVPDQFAECAEISTEQPESSTEETKSKASIPCWPKSALTVSIIFILMHNSFLWNKNI